MKRKKRILSMLTSFAFLTSALGSGMTVLAEEMVNPAATTEQIATESIPDPVMQVTFDDGTATDVTGRGNNGTVYGNPEFVEGVSGQAVHLVNPEDAAGQPPVAAKQYIDFGSPEDLQFGEENFSITFWYKSERPSDRNHKEGAIVSNKNWNSGQNAGFNIGDMRQGINLNFNTDASLKRGRQTALRRQWTANGIILQQQSTETDLWYCMWMARNRLRDPGLARVKVQKSILLTAAVRSMR